MEDQEYSSLKETTHFYGPFAFMGLAIINSIHSLIFYFSIIGGLLSTLILFLFGRVSISWSDITYRVKIYGIARIGFTLILTFLVSIVFTTVIGMQFIDFGLSGWANRFVTLALIHNIVPAMLGLFLLINLAKHFHVDALELKSYAKTVPDIHAQLAKKSLPEIIACLITLTIAYFYAIFAVLCGEVLAGSNLLNKSLGQYQREIQGILSFNDIIKGLIVTILIAFFLGVLKSHYLFYTREQNFLEGRHIINMMVIGIFTIFTISVVLKMLFIATGFN